MYQKNNLRVCCVASVNYMNVVLLVLQTPMSIWKLTVFCSVEHWAIGGENKNPTIHVEDRNQLSEICLSVYPDFLP